MWEQLVVILEEMLAVYKQLLVYGQTKKDALVAAKVKEVDACTRGEEILIFEAGKLESRLQATVQELSGAYGLEPHQVTMAVLLDKAAPPLRVTFTRLNDEFSSIVAKLQEVNDRNTALIEKALVIVNYNMNLLTQNTVGPTYIAGGKASADKKNPALFDKKV